MSLLVSIYACMWNCTSTRKESWADTTMKHASKGAANPSITKQRLPGGRTTRGQRRRRGHIFMRSSPFSCKDWVVLPAQPASSGAAARLSDTRRVQFGYTVLCVLGPVNHPLCFEKRTASVLLLRLPEGRRALKSSLAGGILEVCCWFT